MALDWAAAEEEVVGCVSAVSARVKEMEALSAEGLSTKAKAQKLEAMVKEVEQVLGQLKVLKQACSEKEAEVQQKLEACSDKEAEVQQRWKDVEKTRGELDTIQLGMKDKADARAKIFVLASQQQVNGLRVELAAEKKRREEAEERLQCAQAEAGIWKGRFREESTRRLGLLVGSFRQKESLKKQLFKADLRIDTMRKLLVTAHMEGARLRREIESSRQSREQEALEASIEFEEEKQLFRAAALNSKMRLERKIVFVSRKADALLQTQAAHLHLGARSGYVLFKLLQRLGDMLHGETTGLVPLLCSDLRLQVALEKLQEASDDYTIASDVIGFLLKASKQWEELRAVLEETNQRAQQEAEAVRLSEEARMAEPRNEAGANEEEDEEEEEDAEWNGFSEEGDVQQDVGPPFEDLIGDMTAERSSGPHEAAGGLSDRTVFEEASAPHLGSEEEEGEIDLSGLSDERVSEQSSSPHETTAGPSDETILEEASAPQGNGLQRVLASVEWPASWDAEHRRALYDELMGKDNAAALGEDEWKAHFDRAVSRGQGACLVPMLVERIRSGYNMPRASVSGSRKSCPTHGKAKQRAGPCVWVAMEVRDGSAQLVIKARE